MGGVSGGASGGIAGVPGSSPSVPSSSKRTMLTPEMVSCSIRYSDSRTKLGLFSTRISWALS